MAEEPHVKGREDLMTLAQASRHLAQSRMAENDWSGVAVPVPGLDLVVEPRYKLKALTEFRWRECYDENGTPMPLEEEPAPQPSEYVRVNSWWNARFQVQIVVVKDKQGRASYTVRFEERLGYVIRTLEAATAWPLEAEEKAQKKLAELVTRENYELYMLTGHLPEVSQRSQVTYLFRKGRPTLAFRQTEEGTMLLCALCLHPIGYYGESWAGVMCPTDEVIAHLLMMRGCEEKYWANANQHPLDRPTSGL